ncbi:MAG: PLP-dependent transferase [Desulfobulbales bacterium]|nr:PLP-dependent transferase [Desulfobulbales bacterium]
MVTGFATRAIHGPASLRDPKGSLRTPVYDSAAFEHESAEALRLTFAGNKAAHVYSRISNPTVHDFEQRLGLLSGGIGVLAVSSGMAAISNTILVLAGAGTNIVASRHMFGNTLSLFERTLRPWGLEVKYVSMDDPAALAGAIDPETRAVFIETMSNPQLEVPDCRKISAITRGHGVPLILDNTLLTPYLFNSGDSGVDIEILSSTKYISGGGTSVGGVIIDNGNFDWRQAPRLRERAETLGRMALIAALRQEVYRNVGACLSPHNAYLQSLGLETMSLRIDKSCANALATAEYLENHPLVKRVNYPGLASSPYHELAGSQFGGGYGGVLTFDLESNGQCFAFCDALQLIRRATNINDNKTLIIHPASTLFAEYSDEEKVDLGLRPTMLRLSAGIEDLPDLIGDLDEGFKALA